MLARTSWIRIVLMLVLVGAVAWWLHERKERGAEAPPMNVIAVEILPADKAPGGGLAEAPAGTTLWWLRLEDSAWDVPWPGAGATDDVHDAAAALSERAFQEITQLAKSMRTGDPAHERGEVRVGADIRDSVPVELIFRALNALFDAGIENAVYDGSETRPEEPAAPR